MKILLHDWDLKKRMTALNAILWVLFRLLLLRLFLAQYYLKGFAIEFGQFPIKINCHNGLIR